MLFSEDFFREVEKRLEQRRTNFPDVPFPDKAGLEVLEEDVREALIFLYAWMPLSDAAQVPLETFLDYARTGAALRNEKKEVRNLPDGFFGEYVLFHRVNTEEIRPCRSLFRERIGARTQNLPQLEAALAVNEWCAENGTYHSDDDRTISALAFYQRGYGRCGEESVFCVNAMRSVGIPSRQVYVPFWPHTDDNHAWVEFFADGQWHFLGACEPMPAADAGWFNLAASRAMLVHSRLYTDPGLSLSEASDGRMEEIADRMDIAWTLNQLPRYSNKTRTIHIRTLDAQGCPKAGVPVELELLNMAHWCSIACPVSDALGNIRFTTGRGSLRIRIRGSRYSFTDLVPGDDEAVLTDDREEKKIMEPGDAKQSSRKDEAGERPEENWRNIDFLTPAGQPEMVPHFSSAERENNSARLKHLEALRKKRTDNWKNPAIGVFLGEDTAPEAPYECPDKAAGTENIKTASDRTGGQEIRRKIVSLLSEKDRTDCPEGVLEDDFREALKWQGTVPEKIFEKGILSPRIDDEILRPWRMVLSSAITEQEKEEFRKNPELIVRRIQQRVKSFPEEEREGVITSPAACWTCGTGSRLSGKILTVAIARVCHIPSWLRPEDKAVMIWQDGQTRPLMEKDRQSAALRLHVSGNRNLQYMVTWSLSVWNEEEGDWQVLHLTAQPHSGVLTVPLVPGRYLLVTANRLPDGSLYASELPFQIREGETREYDLALREIPPEKMLMSAEVASFEPGQALPGPGEWRLWFWIDPGEEPTEHILNELLENKEEYGLLQEKLVFLDSTDAGRKDPLLERVLHAFPKALYISGADTQDREDTARSMYLDPGSLPIIVLARNGSRADYSGSSSLTGVFGTCGYNVGTGRMLLKVIRTMEQTEEDSKRNEEKTK